MEDQTARKSWSQFMQEHGKELHELDEGAFDQTAREGWQRDHGDEQEWEMSETQAKNWEAAILQKIGDGKFIDLSRSTRFR